MTATSSQPSRLPASDLRVIAVLGPTGVGKSRLAEDIALALGGEIVSADSMQVYRGMDIGTAKPPEAERRVPVHGIDLVEPGEDYSAALFQRYARGEIAGIAQRDRVPILAGGTGLYVRAALDDLRFPSGDTGGERRVRLETLATELGSEALHEHLRAVDPDSAALIHPNNVRRTIRALEMAEEGISYAEQAAGFGVRSSVYDTRFLGLEMEREKLYARINARVDDMVGHGLLDEIQTLLDSGFRDALTAAQAIGYKEFVPVIEIGADLAEAIDCVKQATRRYAKRQLTWLRSDERIAWIDTTGLTPEQTLERALELLESYDTRSPSGH